MAWVCLKLLETIKKSITYVRNLLKVVLPESGNVCRIAIWRLSLQPRSLWVSELGKTAHKLGARKRALLSHI